MEEGKVSKCGGGKEREGKGGERNKCGGIRGKCEGEKRKGKVRGKIGVKKEVSKR